MEKKSKSRVPQKKRTKKGKDVAHAKTPTRSKKMTSAQNNSKTEKEKIKKSVRQSTAPDVKSAEVVSKRSDRTCKMSDVKSMFDKLKPKFFMIRRRSVDENECSKMVEKIRFWKSQPHPVSAKHKSEYELDRVKKKPGLVKFLKKGPTPDSGLIVKSPSTNSINKLSDASKSLVVEKPRGKSEVGSDPNCYDDVPKLADILKKPEEDIFKSPGVPFWMTYLEPLEEDAANSDPPIAVGSEHVEMFHEKKLSIKNPPDLKLVLDQWQPLVKLMERDNLLFTPELVFSNTIRSLIISSAKSNVMIKKKSSKKIENRKRIRAASKFKRPKKFNSSDTLVPGFKVGASLTFSVPDMESESTTQEEISPSVTIGNEDKFVFYMYLRSKPIETASKKVEMSFAELEAGKEPDFS